METQDIRAELVRRKISVKTIANQLGVSSPSVSQVISRKVVSAKIREAIAKAINKPVTEVFPPTPKEPQHEDKDNLCV